MKLEIVITDISVFVCCDCNIYNVLRTYYLYIDGVNLIAFELDRPKNAPFGMHSTKKKKWKSGLGSRVFNELCASHSAE